MATTQRNTYFLRSTALTLCTLCIALCIAASPASLYADIEPPQHSPDQFWTDHVQPILDKKCMKCHAGVRQQSNLDLRSLETILRGGDSGPEIVPGKPAQSRLIQYVSPVSGPHMPPDPTKRLSLQEVATIRDWVAQLPAADSKLTSSASKDNKWVAGYMADYRRATRSREVPPANLPAASAIDWFLETDWRRSHIVPARICADNAFIRRVFLDITGRIPTKSELMQFIGDSRADKRSRLVHQLLSSDDYVHHLRDVFDTVLMGRPTEKSARERAESGWYGYLENAFRTNRPWNDMVRDILTARPTDSNNRGADWFLAERNNSYQSIAEAVAPVVYGVQIKCAQCHNHPLVWEIEQRHYWGLVAVFSRSSNVKTSDGVHLAESAIGGFNNFANLKKESQPALLVFLNGKIVNERIPGANEKEVDSPSLYLVPPGAKDHIPQSAAVPKVSRREEFAEAATHDNPMLARAMVNRMWDCLMGRGIVSPADQIDSRHPASHPELLEWLAQDFETSGYDIKRLVQNIVLSRAYQLDSRPTGKSAPPQASFAQGLEKPLAGEQLYESLVIATGAARGQTNGTDKRHAFVAAFPDIMQETYNPSLQQALFLTNSPVVDDMLKPSPGNTTARLMALTRIDLRIREAYLTVLGRSPDAMELQQCKQMLTSQSVEKGVKNLLWALISSAEFKVNH